MRFIKLLKEPEKISLSSIEALKSKIITIAEKFNLSLFYIYGSLAQDKMGALSDIDIAVEYQGERGLDTDKFLELLSDLQEVFGREDIDLVELREVPPVLKMRILQKGKLVYSKDKKSVLRFRSQTLFDYLRTGYLRRSFFAQVRKILLKEVT